MASKNVCDMCKDNEFVEYLVCCYTYLCIDCYAKYVGCYVCEYDDCWCEGCDNIKYFCQICILTKQDCRCACGHDIKVADT